MITHIGILNIISVVYLSFVVAFTFGLNEHDVPGKIVRATIVRWVKLLLALLVISIVVRILGKI